MFSLISVNIETDKHYKRIIPFITERNPEVICLQEAPESVLIHLKALGYSCSFLPMTKKVLEGGLEVIGVAIATKTPHAATQNYYHKPSDTLVTQTTATQVSDIFFGYLITTIRHEGKDFIIATTHLPDTKDGKEDEFQSAVVSVLIEKLKQEPPHCLCGDFNMPRGVNTLYSKMTELYTDTIPKEYASSLDRSLHRLGNIVLDQPIFEKYMVDYLFCQKPYEAETVELHFGVSDHAAITAKINY